MSPHDLIIANYYYSPKARAIYFIKTKFEAGGTIYVTADERHYANKTWSKAEFSFKNGEKADFLKRVGIKAKDLKIGKEYYHACYLSYFRIHNIKKDCPRTGLVEIYYSFWDDEIGGFAVDDEPSDYQEDANMDYVPDFIGEKKVIPENKDRLICVNCGGDTSEVELFRFSTRYCKVCEE